MTTPDDLLARRLSRNGAEPLLTFYDLATGERVELSVATTANWVAKATGYLVEELGVEPDDVVTVRLPLHWEATVILLAAWGAGAQVSFDPGPHAQVTVTTATEAADGDGEVVALSLAPMGVDFSRLVASQPDSYRPVSPGGEDLVASGPTDLPHGARVLTVATYDVPGAIGYTLIGPLAMDGSAVLVGRAGADQLAEVAATERATHTFGVDVPGLPRLSADPRTASSRPGS